MQALVRSEPELRQTALTVTEGAPPTVHVIAVNDNAEQAGIEPGMTELQAEERLRLAFGEPVAATSKFQAPRSRWHMRSRSAMQEAATHAALLDCVCAFSPRVEDTCLDTVILDVAGLESLFGPLPKIARDVAQRCSEAGLEVNVATATNPDAAMLAAHGFPGITIIDPGTEAERLGTLSIDTLLALPEPQVQKSRTSRKKQKEEETTATALETLDRWGVRNLRGLAALPDVALIERLGQNGSRLQRLARGVERRELIPAEPPLVFEEAMELEYPVDLLEPLAFLLSRMLEQLCTRLTSRALATQELRLRLELDPDVTLDREGYPAEAPSRAPKLPGHEADADNDATANNNDYKRFYTRSFRLPIPMLDARTFLKLLQLDLRANPPTAPVLKLWLAAEPVRPRYSQTGLFLPVFPEPQKLEVTLARISNVVGGSENVGSAELLDTHRPDAFCMQRFTPPAPVGEKRERTAAAQPWSAMRVFRPPLPISVDVQQGKPVRITCGQNIVQRRISGDVVWAAGPWKSSGEWWAEQWDREEWDVGIRSQLSQSQHTGTGELHVVKTETMAVYRVFRDASSGAWFVAGEYD